MAKKDNVSQSDNQIGPRHAEDGGSPRGSGVPAPQDRGAIVARNFPVSVNKGEGTSAPTTVSSGCSVNLVTGEHTCK